MEKERASTMEDIREKVERRKEHTERLGFNPYSLRVRQLIDSRITNTEDINEVRKFVESYNPSGKKYEAPKKRLLKELNEYQVGLKK